MFTYDNINDTSLNLFTVKFINNKMIIKLIGSKQERVHASC